MQKPERCAKHSSLFRPQDAVAVFASCAWPIFAARGGARLRKPERCAKHSSLFHPQDAVAVFAPAPLRLFLPQAAPQLRSPPPF